MLALGRVQDEGIVVESQNGETIYFRILRVYHKRVQVGIKAPKECRIIREELLSEEQKKNIPTNNTDSSRDKNPYRQAMKITANLMNNRAYDLSRPQDERYAYRACCDKLKNQLSVLDQGATPQ